jgi:hypothetical protein
MTRRGQGASDPHTRFTVVDLDRQLGALEPRRFAVWDHVASRFWKIHGRQVWTRVDDLIADFAAVWPDAARFHAVHQAQRDALVEQAFALGFPTKDDP